MRPWSTARHSRTPWTHQAPQRADQHRSQRKQRARITHARDRTTTALKEAQARLRQRATQSQGLAVPHQVDLVFFALQLCAVARSGLRAVSRGLSLLAVALGLHTAPGPQPLITWVTRLASVRRQSARRLKGAALSPAPFSHGLLGMIAGSIALGAGKMVAVWALDAHQHRTATALGLEQVRGLAVSVAVSWTGDSSADVLQRRIATVGRPVADRKDAGRELHQAIGVVEAQGLARPGLDEISHAGATRLQRRSHAPPTCATLVSACGRVSATLTHPLLACLAPPTVHTTARCMHVHRLGTWAERVRTLSPTGGARAGSTLAT
jgi:hypothetical protein